MDKLNMNVTQFKTAICNIAKKLKDEKIDYIVTLSKGGLVPSTYLAKYIDVKEIHCIGMRSYEGEKRGKPAVYQQLTTKFNKDDVVLIVDDIVDSGISLTIARKEVSKAGTNNMITCSIFYKPQSTYKPDYYYQEVADDIWVVLPWE